MAWPIPEKIGGKDVYVVESHHHVLKCWAAIRQKLKSPPVLLTFDHHTDTRPAFAAHLCQKMHPVEESRAFCKAVAGKCKTIDFQNLATVENAVRDLAWDEHIDASIRSSVINFAFVVCCQKGYATKRKSMPNMEEVCRFPNATEENFHQIRYAPYDMPGDRSFVIAYDDFDLSNCDQAIETGWLEEVLLNAVEMATSSGENNPFSGQYVLDIDLDYFHTRKAIAPDDPLIFLWLVRYALAVTIATEPKCIKCFREGESLDSDYLLFHLKHLIEIAGKADLPHGWEELTQTFH